jgi:hypothetical protein
MIARRVPDRAPAAQEGKTMANQERDRSERHAFSERIREPRSEATEKAPDAPGAAQSPQHPGMVPDRSTVPGHFSERLAPPSSVRRPLTQYGTAEEIMSVFKRVPESELTPADFEQATATAEELRKAYLNQLPPERPAAALPSAPTPPSLPEGER